MRPIKHASKFLLFVVIALIFGIGCAKDNDEVSGTYSHVLFIYIGADNNLGNYYDINNISDIEEAIRSMHASTKRVVIYHDAPGKTPVLFSLEKNALGNSITKRILKEYQSQNSADPATLKEVLSDLKQLVPARSYGAIFWSHGTGWLPAGSTYGNINNFTDAGTYSARRQAPQNPYPHILTKAFCLDNHDWMEADQFAESIPSGLFNYIIFDACFMGEAEIVYELKDKTRYIVASSAEILADGMPYSQIVKSCLANDLEQVCKQYFETYNAKSGPLKSATIALYDCQEINALAKAYKKIIDRFTTDQLRSFNTTGIQRFDRNQKHTMFDIQDLVAKLIPDANDVDRNNFEQQLKRLVKIKYATARIIDSFTVRTFSGITTYLPIAAYDDLNPSFGKTKWSQAVFK